MISCKANNSTHLSFDLPPIQEEEITHCLYFKDKFFFYFCEKYCENYNIVSEAPVFDGEIHTLKIFV